MHQIFGGLIYQDDKMKCEGVSKMSEKSMLEAVENCLIRRPKVRIALGLASNNFIYVCINVQALHEKFEMPQDNV